MDTRAGGQRRSQVAQSAEMSHLNGSNESQSGTEATKRQ